MEKRTKRGEMTSDRILVYSALVFLLFMVLVSIWTFSIYVDENITFQYHGPGQISVRLSTPPHRKHPDVYSCYAYDVTPWLPADVYAVQGQAELLPGSTKVVKRHTSELLPHSLSRNNAFYLLEGSSIAATACKTKPFSMETKVELLLLKGDNSWQKWINRDCDDCPFRKVVLSHDDLCGENAAVLTYTVQERGTYYIVLTGASLDEVKASLEIRRTTFDLRNAQRVCNDSIKCTVDFVYGQQSDIVLDFKDDKIVSFFGLECHRRIIFIIVFLCFGTFPVNSIITLSIALCCSYVCCRHCKNRTHRSDLPKKGELQKRKIVPLLGEARTSKPIKSRINNSKCRFVANSSQDPRRLSL